MTAAERKWGLRQAVGAKLKSQAEKGIGLWHVEAELLWQIIDSLVDEIEQTKAVRPADGKG